MNKVYKVFDCFPFYDELDLLEIRLNILDDVVDYFVLSEATRTFTGKPKPLHYANNKARFKKFAHKIRHVVVDDSEYKPEIDTWQREFDQKNSVFREVYDCKENDFVIISDVDEIVNPDAITSAISNNPNSISVFIQPCFYYFLNCRSTEVFDKAKMAKFKYVKSPQQLRAYPKFSSNHSNKFLKIFYKWCVSIRKKIRPCVIHENGGWHFTYMKSPEDIRKKIMAFSHTEYDLNEFTSIKSIKSRIESIKDPYDRDYQLKIVEIDDSFPKYISKNKNKYSHIIF